MQTYTVGIVVYDDVEALDVFGPVEAFSCTTRLGGADASGSDRPFRILLVAASLEPVRCFNGPSVLPARTFRQFLDGEESLDVLIVPGGTGAFDLAGKVGDPSTADPELMDFLRKMDGRTQVMASVCVGAALLARSGLLDGRRATTHRGAFDLVTPYGPRVLWDKEHRWVEDGRYVSSAGVSAGTDMALYLVAKLMGWAVARTTEAFMEYRWQSTP
jgi:transcriptional regulator GlxA family with amidase domain